MPCLWCNLVSYCRRAPVERHIHVLPGASCHRPLPQAFPTHNLATVVPFIIGKGLSDANMTVSHAALTAGREIMKQYGEGAVHSLLPILEDFLRDGAASSLSAEDELAQDRQREGVIVFLGSVAQFLPPTDPKVCTACGIAGKGMVAATLNPVCLLLQLRLSRMRVQLCVINCACGSGVCITHVSRR